MVSGAARCRADGMVARKKTRVLRRSGFRRQVAVTLSKLPKVGSLFPSLARLHERNRAQYFQRRCGKAGIKRATLYSYRDRCRTSHDLRPARALRDDLPRLHLPGHPPRLHARRARVVVPTLEEFERGASSHQPLEHFLRRAAYSTSGFLGLET